MHIRCFLNIPSNSLTTATEVVTNAMQVSTSFTQGQTVPTSHFCLEFFDPLVWDILKKNLLTFKGIDALPCGYPWPKGDKSWWANLSCLPWEDGPGVHFIGLLSFAMEIKHPGACTWLIGMHSGICFPSLAIHCPTPFSCSLELHSQINYLDLRINLSFVFWGISLECPHSAPRVWGKTFPKHFVFLLGLKSLLWNNNYIEIVGRGILTV